MRSAAAAATTIARVEPALASRRLTLFATIDHAANARAASLTLPPATVFIFGNPAVGTRVMQCDLASAIDLPLRLLVWEEADGTTWVGYRDPAGLASRHNLAFEARWVRGAVEPPAGEESLGTPDISSLADLAAGYELVQKMRPAPVTVQGLVPLVLTALLPVAVVAATQVPVKQVLGEVKKLLLL